ncbi:hypothetical protein ACIGNX_13095 [Actinosynnema sp. NPDC053489]|uniref:hypothetical protein n=1 Tax=Actinosynnema sp. NPDC053489 TaxID=3363916 RepID=UPI0037CA4EF1
MSRTRGEGTGTRSGATKTVLWLVLLVTAAVNSIGSFVGLDEVARIAAGGVTVLCVVALVALHLRDRR